MEDIDRGYTQLPVTEAILDAEQCWDLKGIPTLPESVLS